MFPRRATGTRVPASINKTQYSFENCDKGAIYCALGRFFACAHMRLKDSRKGTLPGNEIYVHKYCDRIFRRYGDYSDIVLGDSYCSRFRLASCFRYNFRLINKSVEMVFFFLWLGNLGNATEYTILSSIHRFDLIQFYIPINAHFDKFILQSNKFLFQSH